MFACVHDIHVMWYIHTCTTCMYMSLCTCTIVWPYPKLLYQSKSLNEISLNPMGARDRQSTLRFEKSISAVWKKKSCSQTKVVGIILKTSNLVSELLDSHCNIAPISNSFGKKYFTLNKWRLAQVALTTLLRENNIKACNPIFFLYFM